MTCQNGYPCTNGRIDPFDEVTTAFASHFESTAEVSVANAIYVETVGISGGDAERSRAARLRGLAARMRDLDILAAAGRWNTLLADVSAGIGASNALYRRATEARKPSAPCRELPAVAEIYDRGSPARFLSTACLIVSFWFGMFRSWIRERTDRRSRSSANTGIRWLNFGSGLFYLVGLCAFVVFLFMNTPRGDCVPRDGEDFYGEGYDGELEYRSELVHDLPEPDADADAPTGNGGDGGDSGGGDDSSGGGDQ